MKHLLVVIALLVSNHSSAKGSDMAAGIQLGMNSASLSYTNSTTSVLSSTSSKTGFLVGGQFEWKLLDEMLYLAPGLQYSQKGGKISLVALGVALESVAKLDYINIPIHAKLKFLEQSSLRPFIYAGPSVGFLVSSKAENTVGGSTTNVDIKGQTKSVDITADFGAGGEYDIAEATALYLQLGYSLGLSNIDRSTGGLVTEKTQTWQFILGCNFEI